MNLLLTGVTGFLGSRLMQVLLTIPELSITATARRQAALNADLVVEVQDLSATTDWSVALVGQDCVIHTAARVHIMKDSMADPLTEYRRVNVDGTLNLARQAVSSGVKRFIFVSSIKVNGEHSPLGKPFTEDSYPSPEGPYAISKFEAEKGLKQLSQETGLEVVIIRPPLVYGPGVKGNFGNMIKLVQKGVPFPLGAIHNKRSLVAIDNLVDLIITCIDHTAAGNQIFLAGDGQDLSITDLLRGIAKAMDKRSILLPIPSSLLMLGARLFGREPEAHRLLGSLQVDISKARTLLGWEPPISLDEGLSRCLK